MCTLAVAWRVDRRWPIVAAANRDERMGRPSQGWALREAGSGVRYAAPGDLLAGGTWMGLSDRGVLAGLTNFHAPFEWYPDPARRSRGEIVPLALAAPSAAEARARLADAPAERWNPFHLLVADSRSAFLWWYDGERAAFRDLAPGLHVVTERSPDGACARGELVRARWPLEPSAERLREVLTIHAREDAAGTCIHGDPVYGTRSSAVVRVASDLAASELLVADGRPCVTPLEDRSALVAALARAA
ncbi:MAG TPA: NRDE family protein [Anaeromyxobacter sp.]|nr:NRDE family protein [Anaeromyxobacter sp.]